MTAVTAVTAAPLAAGDPARYRALAAVDTAPAPVEWFLLNTEANVEVDITSVDALDELRTELQRRGIVFAMARVKQNLRDQLTTAGLVRRIGENHIFPTLPTAVHVYTRWYTRRHGHPPAGAPATPPSPSGTLGPRPSDQGPQ